MIVASCQRWRDRRERPVPAGSLINPSIMAVDEIAERVARPFVERHHYSGTFPAGRLSVGLFRHAELVGVGVFSEGVQRRALPHWAGVDPGEGCELGRLVLLDDVPGNAESWFLARAFSALRRAKPDVEAVLSYADPLERRDAAGRLVKPGHVGTIYQALSARYRGRTGKRTGYMTAAGEIVSGRALSKIRLDERGADYAAGLLETKGAPCRARGELGRSWLARLVDEGFLRRFSHPGNHAYVFPLTRRARVAGAGLTVQPYPKLDTI